MPLGELSHCDEVTLLATDLQTSVMHGVSPTISQPQSYGPYGHRPTTNRLLNVLGFNGERPDAMTGHYLLGQGYRAFNPVLMRFNNPDRGSPFGRGGINAYTYCEGDPINYQDPTGRTRWNFIKSILGLFKKQNSILCNSTAATSSTFEKGSRRLSLKRSYTNNHATRRVSDPGPIPLEESLTYVGAHGTGVQH